MDPMTPRRHGPSRPGHLVIDQLVMDGFPVRDPAAFKAAFQRALSAHLANHPEALDGLDSRSNLRLEVSRRSSANSAELGAEAARQLIRGLGT